MSKFCGMLGNRSFVGGWSRIRGQGGPAEVWDARLCKAVRAASERGYAFSQDLKKVREGLL